MRTYTSDVGLGRRARVCRPASCTSRCYAAHPRLNEKRMVWTPLASELHPLKLSKTTGEPLVGERNLF